VTLDNKIKCLSLALFFVGNPTNETVTGAAYVWGILFSKPPGPFIMIDQSEILNCSYVQLIILFFGDAQTVLRLFPARQAAGIWCRKSNSLS
jgi:hypothetical protein